MNKATDKAKNKLTSLAKEFFKKVVELGIGDGDDENNELIRKELSTIGYDYKDGEVIDKNSTLPEATSEQKDEKIEKNSDNKTDEISSDLLTVLEHIKEFFNLSSINEVLAYLITIADVLANDEELAKMVLLETKNQDGTLSEADLASLMADIKTVNGNEEEDNAVLNELQTKSGLPIEKIDEIAKQLRIEGKEDLINNPNSFLIELEKRGNATPEVARDLEKGLDGVVAEMNQYKPIKPEVKIKTISLNKKDKRPEGENFQQLVSRKMKQFGL